MKFNHSRSIKGLSRPNWLVNNSRNIRKIWIDKNELIYPPFLNLFKKILKKIKIHQLSVYPELANIYKLLSKKINFPLRQIMLTNGSDDAIRIVFQTLANKEKVLITNPTFAMYEVYSKIYSKNFKKINYKSFNSKPNLNINEIINTINTYKPKLFCLPNPNSPTGTYFKMKEIKKLLQNSKKKNCYVLIDEAYYPLSPITMKTLIKQFNNLIIVRSFSKTYGLAGVRLGYILSNNILINEFHMRKNMYEIGNFSSIFLREILETKFDFKNHIIKIRKDKNFLINNLKKRGFKVLNSPANFIHVNFGKNKKQIIKNLKKKIHFRELESHISLNGLSRFSLTTKSNYKKILKIIDNEKI
tara:strand:+ start:209 stop:1282 length:1074 start_codon:yes stop_codon:yes gene_type:complete